MDFLSLIDSYWFLTKATKTMVRQAYTKGALTQGAQKQILDRCLQAKKQLAEQELKLIEAIHDAESQLLHEADSVLRQARTAVEDNQRAAEAKGTEDLESQLDNL